MNLKLEITQRCVECDICRVLCPENAILISNGNYNIENWACSQCGVCLELCPVDCIKIINEQNN